MWNAAHVEQQSQLREFIVGVMSMHHPNENLWTRNPSGSAWIEVWIVDQHTGERTFTVTFNSYFIESEPPQFKPASGGEYDKHNSSNWKAIIVRYDFTYYPAVTALPQFLLKGDTIDVEDLMTFVSFQIEFDMAKLSRLIYSTIVRIYPTTQLDMWLNGNVFSYSSDGATSPMDSAQKFTNWFKTSLDPTYLSALVLNITVDDVSRIATISLKVNGPFDKASNAQALVSPTWIPTFIVKSDESADPPAELIVRPWKITLQSVNRYPPFDRLLDLLEYGVGTSDGSPSSNSTNAGGSYSGDSCSLCATQRQACFDDKECSAAISNNLLPALDTMGAVGNSCIQSLSQTHYPGVTSYLEITRAKSMFPVNKGKGTNVYSLSGTQYYYNDNGSSMELAKFMEDQVLGGYESSGVKVEVSVDWASERYTVIYDGLTTLSVPFIEGPTTVSSPMQFTFWCSEPDLPPKFKPWRTWLVPTH
ncbi:uncharacterized protein PITG_16903 [Phytophthora infestans T30-4]|uniref:Uncharacterized protein n=1 Tax=Phytophthora infestans (strain T30-4) TaxID=403677 RepID=D0NUD0_PHYIT|nr:uncharacterized protein PITG_16903 [Phytophthora infestans T30-4]EEY65263.1 hypothetical protein PITG_16903 [Phytophthora infestans T30-4]|eukprot:XP_002897327.1 hypothetical protein PITG_16903 [Phytophthora infestans T30-4]